MSEKKGEIFVERCVVLYHIDCSWEMDYVFKELLRDMMPKTRVFFLNSEQLSNFKETHPGLKRIVVFSSTTVQVSEMTNLFQRYKPHAVFHFSDEFGTRPQYCELAKLTQQFFHQHRFEQYPRYGNMVHIPLGFKTNYFYPSQDKIIPSPDRELVWSFVGTLKKNSNRPQMLQVMGQELKPNFSQTNGGVTPMKMGEIYSKSIFVPNDRGEVVLNCFRLYEAMLAGAIPVVVGNKKEIEVTFYFANADDSPPFLIAPTWEKAAKKCRKLLSCESQKQELLQLQIKNVEWIYRHINQIRNALHKLRVND